MSSQFVFYLADPWGGLGKNFNHELVASLMLRYFDKIFKNRKIDAGAAAWIDSPRAIAPWEFLIYFVPSRMQSLVTSMEGAHLLPINDKDGMTVFEKQGKH